VNQAWIDAARTYGGFTDSERATYWNSLGPEQQQMLISAINMITASQSSARNLVGGRSCLKTFSVGCFVVLGIALSLTLVILAVTAGGQMVSDLLPAAEDSEERPWFFPDFDPMPSFCKDGMASADRVERNLCEEWAKRHSSGGSWEP
jgi:hypothetical protein